MTLVSPDYFRAMEIAVVRGRHFDERDNRDHLRGAVSTNLSDEQRWAAGLNTIIVDEEFVRRHWPNEEPIGKRIRLPWGDAGQQPVLTVAGVVRRVRINQLHDGGGFVQGYLPFLQGPASGMTIVLKTAVDPGMLGDAIRAKVQAVDPMQPIYDLRPVADLRDRSLAGRRLNFLLLTAFAVVALGLAVVGFYGVLAYTVAQRRREIGVRVALGAQRRDVLGLVIGHGMQLTLAGVVLGVAGAVAVGRLLAGLLFEIRPFDPITLVSVPILLLAVALFACWLPARRAAALDPVEALRCD
jgi:predicted permease